MTSLRRELQQQNVALQGKTLELHDAEQQLKSLQQRLQGQEAIVRETEAEKRALESSLEELDAQHAQVMQELIRKRDELVKANEDLQEQVMKHQNAEEIRKVASEQEAAEKMEALVQEKHNLEGLHKEMEEELRTTKEELILLRNDETQEEVRRAEETARLLQIEWEQKAQELQEMKQKLQQGALSLNELHMDKKELEARTKKLQNELQEAVEKVGHLSKEKRNLEELHKKIQEELNSTKEELTTLRTDGHERLQEELLQLKENLDQSQLASVAHEEKITHFEEEIRRLQDQLEMSVEETSQLSAALQNSILAENHLKEELEKQNKKFSLEIDSLKEQRNLLEKELHLAEAKQRDQVKQYEACIEELRTARQLDANSLQTEHENLIKCSHEKDTKMSELQNECDQLRAHVNETKDLLQDSLNGQSSLKEMINQKQRETDALRSDNSALKTTLEETIANSHALQKDADHLAEMHKASNEKCKELQQQIEALESQAESKDAEAEKYDDTLIINLESQIADLQNTTEEQKEKLEAYQKQIEALELQGTGHPDPAVMKQYEDTIQEHQSSISFLQFDLSAKNTELQQATEKVKRLTDEVNEYKAKLQEAKEASDAASNNNSDEGSAGSSQATELQLEELRWTISQKDDIVNELRSNNEALLRLLEERSVQLHGDNTLVEMHRLENELRSLRMEKDQIMNVLNEKSRECSSLKGEVHRLMNVISQEKAALTKLQQDNQDLVSSKQQQGNHRSGSHGRHSRPGEQDDDVNREMTKEAVKKLSQIIRDKDLEIESLTQKNETLLQVLQETSGASSDAGSQQLGSLLQDKENLMKQVILCVNQVGSQSSHRTNFSDGQLHTKILVQGAICQKKMPPNQRDETQPCSESQLERS